MEKTEEEQYGLLALTNIMSSVWLGDWDRYEEIFQAMDDELLEYFPFHQEYERDHVSLWHENHFAIPGKYFIPPYFSSHGKGNGEEKKKRLLCLIGTYEKMGFYFPLQQEMYPDHIGCMLSFVGAIQQEKLKLNKEEKKEELSHLQFLELDMVKNYIWPVIQAMKSEGQFQHPFFTKFISFSYEWIKDEYIHYN